MTGATFSTTFPALGTTATVAVAERQALAPAAAVVESTLEQLDRTASRFRDDSELSTLNRSAGRSTPVSPLLFRLIETALEAADRTDGLVDPTVGHAVALLGYDKDFAEIAPTGPPLVAKLGRLPGWQGVRLDRRARTVTVPPGVQLDLGATAKAACADHCAGRAAEVTGSGTLVGLGGDLRAVGPPPDGGWPVRVADRHDFGPKAPGVVVAIDGGGLATSGTAARRWVRGDEHLHHIVDPRTGTIPPLLWRTVSVTAATCLEANTASTAAVILGPAAPAWLRQRGYHARLVTEDGSEVAVGGWPLDALRARPPLEELAS